MTLRPRQRSLLRSFNPHQLKSSRLCYWCRRFAYSLTFSLMRTSSTFQKTSWHQSSSWSPLTKECCTFKAWLSANWEMERSRAMQESKMVSLIWYMKRAKRKVKTTWNTWLRRLASSQRQSIRSRLTKTSSLLNFPVSATLTRTWVSLKNSPTTPKIELSLV